MMNRLVKSCLGALTALLVLNALVHAQQDDCDGLEDCIFKGMSEAVVDMMDVEAERGRLRSAVPEQVAFKRAWKHFRLSGYKLFDPDLYERLRATDWMLKIEAPNGLADCQRERNAKLCTALRDLTNNDGMPAPYMVDAMLSIAETGQGDGFSYPEMMGLLPGDVGAYLREHANWVQDQRAVPMMPPYTPEHRGDSYYGFWGNAKFSVRDRTPSLGDTLRLYFPLALEVAQRADMPGPRIDALNVLAELSRWFGAYRPALPVLLAMEPDFPHDWGVAMMVVKALAFYQGAERDALLQRVAEDHWFRPVRLFAQAVLNQQKVLADGGAIDAEWDEIDAVFQDNWRRSFLQSGLRPIAEHLHGDAVCRPDEEEIFVKAVAPRRFGWPSPKSGESVGLAWLTFEPVTDSQQDEFYSTADKAVLRRQHFLRFKTRLSKDQVFATGMGEFPGGVYRKGPNLAAQLLLPETGDAVIRLDDRLIVVSATYYFFFSSEGAVSIINRKQGRAVLSTYIRAPQRIGGIAALGPDILIFYSDAGDMVMRADGTVLDPRDYADCNKVRHGVNITPGGEPCDDLESCISKATIERMNEMDTNLYYRRR